MKSSDSKPLNFEFKIESVSSTLEFYLQSFILAR